MKFKELVEIIEEEIYLELLDRMIASNNPKEVVYVTEMLDEIAAFKKRDPGYGRKWKKGKTPGPSGIDPSKAKDDTVYTSAGNIFPKKGGPPRNLTPAQVTKREQLGNSMLNAMRGGIKRTTDAGTPRTNYSTYEKMRLKLQAFIHGWAAGTVKKKPSRNEIFSHIWAFASVLAYNDMNNWEDYFDLTLKQKINVWRYRAGSGKPTGVIAAPRLRAIAAQRKAQTAARRKAAAQKRAASKKSSN